MTADRLPARYAPEMPFPPYAFVPGKHPHPVRDPQGHSFGQHQVTVPCPDAAELKHNPEFLYGIDLFNHGYYWEAHEVWEGLWHACGRKGPLADFLKGLIHLGAAGVKAREGIPNGVKRHAERAKGLFKEVGHSPLLKIAEGLMTSPRSDSTDSKIGNPVLGIRLELEQLSVP